jgi:hypothetical protein
MNRRNFLTKSALLTTGFFVGGKSLYLKNASIHTRTGLTNLDLFELFRNPDISYHPYIRWWWNGDKVEARELIRELRLLKDAGIGGVEYILSENF